MNSGGKEKVGTRVAPNFYNFDQPWHIVPVFIKLYPGETVPRYLFHNGQTIGLTLEYKRLTNNRLDQNGGQDEYMLYVFILQKNQREYRPHLDRPGAFFRATPDAGNGDFMSVDTSERNHAPVTILEQEVFRFARSEAEFHRLYRTYAWPNENAPADPEAHLRHGLWYFEEFFSEDDDIWWNPVGTNP
jgi:hypothetical protein